MSNQQAPHWCPNAKATKLGWEDPVTGELLVSDSSLEIAKPKPAVSKMPPVSPIPKKKK